MKRLLWSIAAGSGLIALGIARSNPIAMAGAANPVVVELFTSQGCSSCPPADHLISTLGNPKLRDRVIPLAFHVDYWDRLGWRDPFSSPAWTTRQEEYARAMGLNGTYTPQIVVGGGHECVGSDQSRVIAAIQEEGARRAPVKITLAPISPAGGGHNEVGIRVTARVLVDALRDPQIVAAVFESGLETKIRTGERGGERLINDFTVRRLIPIFELAHRAGSQKSGDVVIPIEAGWNRDRVGVAVFAQDPMTLKIEGANALSDPVPPRS